MATVAPSEIRIVLLTMVKNEEKNVRRLFQSVRSWIDGYVLCDTGSTDGTVAIAEGLLKEFEKPGRVYQYAWENFGKSRTKSFECFQDWVRTVGWNPETTYGILLDGDMVLEKDEGLHVKLAVLGADTGGVHLNQRNGNLLYKNTRLVRASKTWKCIGATHEYWTCENGSVATFEEPVIHDIGDGGCKADKYPRDARLLEEDLKTDPNNVRTWFYLGQTYMSIPGRNEDALRALTRRIELGGWEEERYIAHCYKGDVLKALGREHEATEEWLKAWQLRQHRTEAAIRLIQHYRIKPSMAFIAFMYLEKLIQLQLGETLEGQKLYKPLVNRDILFVNFRDMTYTIWEELGITAFYTNRTEGARFRLDRKVMESGISFWEHNRLLELYHWYNWRLPTVGERKALRIDEFHLEFLGEGFWRPFNPSIRLAPTGDHYILNLRHANYETKEARIYTFRAKEGLVITRNVIVPMNAKFEVLTDASGGVARPFELLMPPSSIVNTSTTIHGIEDLRWLGETSLIGTGRQFYPSETNKMVRIDIDYATSTVKSLKPLPCPNPHEEKDVQKNWLPFVWRGEDVFIYKINPFQVFTVRGYTKRVEWSPKPGLGITFDNLRGSAPPVAWKSAAWGREALVMVVHFCFYGSGDEGRRYYHRFITLNDDLTPSRISRIFSLCDDKIQYVAGMCPAISGNGYVLTYGVGDSQAWAIEVTKETIEGSLEYSLN